MLVISSNKFMLLSGRINLMIIRTYVCTIHIYYVNYYLYILLYIIMLCIFIIIYLFINYLFHMHFIPVPYFIHSFKALRRCGVLGDSVQQIYVVSQSHQSNDYYR